jgi:hypothetical protein
MEVLDKNKTSLSQLKLGTKKNQKILVFWFLIINGSIQSQIDPFRRGGSTPTLIFLYINQLNSCKKNCLPICDQNINNLQAKCFF